MRRRGVKESDPYDWEKIPTAVDNAAPPANSTTSHAIMSRTAPGAPLLNLPAPCIPDNLRENFIAMLDNNQENIEPLNRRDYEVRDTLPSVNKWIGSSGVVPPVLLHFDYFYSSE